VTTPVEMNPQPGRLILEMYSNISIAGNTTVFFVWNMECMTKERKAKPVLFRLTENATVSRLNIGY
jgi:hypothetical protein